jgi:hypothetical protein
MKGCRIYFLRIINDLQSDSWHSDDFSNPLYQQLGDLIELNDVKYLGFTDSNGILLQLETLQLKKVINLFENHFDITITDVTDQVLSGEMEKMYPEVEELTPNFFSNFRLENTSIDDVLDKINNLGSKSLDNLDLKIINLGINNTL